MEPIIQNYTNMYQYVQLLNDCVSTMNKDKKVKKKKKKKKLQKKNYNIQNPKK